MKLKALVLAAGLSMLASSSFAAGYAVGFDLSPNGLVTTDGAASTGPNDLAAYFLATPVDNSAFADNTALISQDGSANPNAAYIEQSTGAGNFAVIMQDGANNSNNAAVYQIGNLNSAMIYQH
jgi:hypothetical protein